MKLYKKGYPVHKGIVYTNVSNGKYCRAYDRWENNLPGYVNLNTKYFIPDYDPDEKKREENNSRVDADPSYGERVTDSFQKVESVIGDAMVESAKDILKGTLAAFAFLIGGVAISTYNKEMQKNNLDKEGAIKKATRNAACALGIIGVFAALLICTVIIMCLGNILGVFAAPLYYVLVFIGGYTIFGLIRIMRDKPFFISVSRNVQKIREIYVPRIVYVCIMILSVVLLFQPVINLLDKLTMDWFEANKASFTEIQVIGMVAGMAGLSVLVGVLVGAIVCTIIKKITAKAYK